MLGNRLSPGSSKASQIFHVVSITLLILSLVGCGIESSTEKAVEAFNRAIRDIQNDSSQWRSVLQRLADELPEDISTVIRNDVQNLASRSIAEAGDQFSCRVDFLANRAIQSLERVKTKLLGGDPTPQTPMFCKLVPVSVDLNVDPATWRSITIHGYDMNQVDENGQLFGVVMLDSYGNVVGTIPESKIFRGTHYEVSFTVDVNMAKEFVSRQVAKLAMSWSGKNQVFLESQGQVGIVRWESKRITYRDQPTGSCPNQPPPTRGDKDFDTGDEDPTDVRLAGEMRISDNRQIILGRVYLWAQERHPDYTTVEGWSEWCPVYQADPFYQIINYVPNLRSVQDAVVTTHGDQHYARPHGEVVQEFVAWIDRDGDEAGDWTHVVAYWRPINVTVERLLPEWWK